MDYRKVFKDYYSIDFNNDYEIHHIDFNRDNNDISNLLLLPKNLHAEYHGIINSTKGSEKGILDLRLSNEQFILLKPNPFKHINETFNQIKKWLLWKKYNYDFYVMFFIFSDLEIQGIEKDIKEQLE